MVNKGGLLGAYISSFLLEFFGLANLVSLLFAFAWGVHFVKKTDDEFLPLRFVSFLISLISLCFFLSYFAVSHDWEFVSYGGIVGYYIKYLLVESALFDLYVFASFLAFVGFFCFAHAISFETAAMLSKKLISNLTKKLVQFAKAVPIYCRNIYAYCRFILEKRFFKKRIKDIDSEYIKPKKEKCSKN